MPAFLEHPMIQRASSCAAFCPAHRHGARRGKTTHAFLEHGGYSCWRMRRRSNNAREGINYCCRATGSLEAISRVPGMPTGHGSTPYTASIGLGLDPASHNGHRPNPRPYPPTLMPIIRLPSQPARHAPKRASSWHPYASGPYPPLRPTGRLPTHPNHHIMHLT